MRGDRWSLLLVTKQSALGCEFTDEGLGVQASNIFLANIVNINRLRLHPPHVHDMSGRKVPSQAGYIKSRLKVTHGL